MHKDNYVAIVTGDSQACKCIFKSARFITYGVD
jgi:hypothetical protein